MRLAHSILAGNTVNGGESDVYTGSLLHFYSSGYNLVGVLDMSQLLAPIPLWSSLHRRHWPAPGDLAGVALDAVVDRSAAVTDAAVLSAGVGGGAPTALAYPPAGQALNRIPPSYRVPLVHAQWAPSAGARTPDGKVLTAVVARYRRTHPEVDLPDFGDLDAIAFKAEPAPWPSLAENADWLVFWRRFDEAVAGRLGPNAGLDNAFWSTFRAHPAEGPVRIRAAATSMTVRPQKTDQLGRGRPLREPADIGALETP
jgi:hypothetical protein